MTTLTQLAQDLQIGKGTLYKTLSELGITPHKQGRSRVLDEDQIQQIQEVITAASVRRPLETVKRQNRDAGTDGSIVAEVLQAQIDHLKKLLDSEKEEKSGLLKRLEQEQGASERVQQLLSVTMAETSKLRQENERLRLLEHHSMQTTESVRSEEVYSSPPPDAEFKITEEPAPIAANQKRWPSFGLGLSVAAIVGVMFYAAVTSGGEWLSASLEEKISAVLKVNGTEPDTR
jgi:hypothetical protein